MTLITIAPGVRVLRRHPDRDVLIVEGLGEYATLFIESIPGGWCVVNGEAATKRIYEQSRQCEEGGMDNGNMKHLTPVSCPFCGGQPEILPKDPSVSGSAWGRVSCLNDRCSARPAVEHYGDGDCPYDDPPMASAWNKRQAVLEWNRRAGSAPNHDGMDEQKFSEIEARHYAATPGKWRVTRGEVAGLQVSADDRGVCCMYSDATEANAKFIAHARQDVPDLILEVRRLQADNRRLSDSLRHVSTAIGEHLRPGQTPERAIMRIVGDLAACERERDAYRSSAELAADRANRAQAERDELRLSLLAERGDIKGAPDGWKRTGSMWFRPLGPVNHQVEVRRGTIYPTGEPYHWTLYTPTLAAEGYAPYAREAMKRADKAFQEKA